MRYSYVVISCILACVIAASHVNKHKNHHLHTHSKHGSTSSHNDHKNHDVKLVVIRETIAVIGLLLCLAGSRIIKITMFMGGFILLFVVTYLTLPSIADNDTCCGPRGNWMIRIGICLIVAILGGLLTLLVYYVGIFAIGGILGMVIALIALSTPLAEQEFFGTAMGVGLFYGAFVIVGGLLALLLSTIAVALASSIGGSYAVFYGVDYFANTNFSGGIEVLLIQMQDHIRDEFGLATHHGHHPDFFRQYTLKDAVICTFFVILAVMGFVFQIYLAKSDAQLKRTKPCKDCQCSQYHKDSQYIVQYLKSLQLNSSHDSVGKEQESLLKH